MSDPRIADMGFRDYLTNALMRLGDAEAAYNALVDGDDSARDEVTNLLADAAIAISLGSSKALADATALSRATRGEINPDEVDDADMWAAIAADVDAGLGLEDTHEVDADRDAQFLADTGDLLEPEPFGWAPEAHDLVFPVAGPQEDRADRTARDWNRAAEEGERPPAARVGSDGFHQSCSR